MTGSAGSGKPGRSKHSELIAAWGAVIAALVAGVGVVVSCGVASSQNTIARQTDVTARYSAVSHDIGSDQQLTREAALYAVKDLARDNPPNSCRESAQLLGVYLRWASPRVQPSESAPRSTPASTSAVSTDEIRVAAGMLATVTRLPSCKGQDMPIDLAGVDLQGSHMPNWVVNRSLLDGIVLSGGEVNDAVFTCTTLTNAKFVNTDIGGARFDKVFLDNANFKNIQDAAALSSKQFSQVYWSRSPIWPDGFSPPSRTGGEADYKKACP